MFVHKILVCLIAFLIPSLALAEPSSPWNDGLYHVVLKKQPYRVGCIDISEIALANDGHPVYGCRTSTERDSWHMVHGDKVGEVAYRKIEQLSEEHSAALTQKAGYKPPANSSWLGPFFKGTLVTDEGATREDTIHVMEVVDTFIIPKSGRYFLPSFAEVEGSALYGRVREFPRPPADPPLPVIHIGGWNIGEYVLYNGEPLHVRPRDRDAAEHKELTVYLGKKELGYGLFIGSSAESLTMTVIGGKPLIIGRRWDPTDEKKERDLFRSPTVRVIRWGKQEEVLQDVKGYWGFRHDTQTISFWGCRLDGTYVMVEHGSVLTYNEIRSVVYHNGTNALYAARRLGGDTKDKEKE